MDCFASLAMTKGANCGEFFYFYVFNGGFVVYGLLRRFTPCNDSTPTSSLQLWSCHCESCFCNSWQSHYGTLEQSNKARHCESCFCNSWQSRDRNHVLKQYNYYKQNSPQNKNYLLAFYKTICNH